MSVFLSFRSSTENLQNIASKITSSLFIYFGEFDFSLFFLSFLLILIYGLNILKFILGCSHVHILDTILKTKMINRDSWELSDLIFRLVTFKYINLD